MSELEDIHEYQPKRYIVLRTLMRGASLQMLLLNLLLQVLMFSVKDQRRKKGRQRAKLFAGSHKSSVKKPALAIQSNIPAPAHAAGQAYQNAKAAPPEEALPIEEDNMEWELLERSPREWFRKRYPDWSEEDVNQAVLRALKIMLVEEHEETQRQLRQQPEHRNKRSNVR